MRTAPLQTPDYWRVNSYGYPNPFIQESKSQEAWITFKSFYDRDNGAYTALKEFWESNRPRKLDSHAVESWKATFEEFGLLYVISRSNRITITPAGKQFYEAAEREREEDFVWIGLNLLLRYPLQGPPRGRPKSPAHGISDVLPYRFLYSATRDLGDYFWWTELERIFCRVFATSEAKPAVEAVRQIREEPARLRSFPLPVEQRKGGFYNSLNQVVNHAGMNHLILTQDDDSEHYGPHEPRRRHFINRNHLSLISVALGDSLATGDCAVSAHYVDRLPTGPAFDDEQAYFDYLGAAVTGLRAVARTAAPQTVTLAGDTVFVLKEGEHFESLTATALERTIRGSTHVLCRIARNHRVILSSDTSWTYLVTGKDAVGAERVRLSLRRARPISNIEPIEALLGEENA
jgi:hypothetical protein